ncbi:MAG: type II toxin-antitoxin system YafQ family toxin [Methylocystis sp.]|nr:type II toxin-antitoxin system YafQ family toxin [Methylocystis sp.]MBI3275418.1 type II toxin-antitoxin system YafQ family toxin [Methylocystis sp.]
MRTPVHTGQFRQDARRAQKRGKDMFKLRYVLSLLIAAEPLPPRLKDHPLTGDWGGYGDCHIEPDWLLLYKIDGNDLILVRTGAHTDLFR